MKLTVGDWFNRLPGVLSNVSLNWSKDYPWEIKLDENKQDSTMLRLPHVLDVSVNFIPIHKMRPENEAQTAFISINNWLTYGAADFTNLEDYDKYYTSHKDSSGSLVTPQDQFLKANITKTAKNDLIEVPVEVEKDDELSFIHKWDKFKENLSSKGAVGTIKDAIKK
jgi:hypothetical protein